MPLESQTIEENKMPARTTNFELVLIGHFAKDKIVYQGQIETSSGGAVYYAGMALARLGWRVAVMTRLHPDDFDRLDEMKEAGVRVFAQAAPATSGIENTYTTADMDRRTCKPLSFAGPFRVEDIPAITARTWIVGPIIAGEVDMAMLKALRAAAVDASHQPAVLALDIQGFVRVPEGHDLVYKNWPQMKEGLALVDVLKVDHAEAEHLTGQTDIKTAMLRLAAFGPKEILLTNAAGVTVYAGGQIYHAPFTARVIKGRTGRGDTCFSTYLAKRQSADPAEACCFAAAVTSLKMEKAGPFSGTLADVNARLHQM
jgi:sugar/nucleoside kinase (ribokinase family)